MTTGGEFRARLVRRFRPPNEGTPTARAAGYANCDAQQRAHVPRRLQTSRKYGLAALGNGRSPSRLKGLLLGLWHRLIEVHVAVGTVRRDGVPACNSRACHFETQDSQGFTAFRARNLEQAPKRCHRNDNDHDCTGKPDNEAFGGDAYQGSRREEKSRSTPRVLRVPSPKKVADGHVSRCPRLPAMLFDSLARMPTMIYADGF